MIYLVSVRTDIPAFYWEWFSERLKEGKVGVRNPYYPEKVSIYSLKPKDVDCLFFLSKNYTPMLESKNGEISFEDLVSIYPCSFSYTITPYDKDIEPYAWDIDKNIENFQRMSEIVGKQSMVWRFDPILFNDKYDVNYHLKAFEKMTKGLAKYTSVCAFSLINIYEKVKRNLPDAIRPEGELLDELMYGMKDIADSYDMIVQNCGRGFEKYGFQWKPCTTMQDLEDTLGFEFKNSKYKNECLMCGKGSNTRDVGVYDTCMMGCSYCYATNNRSISFYNNRRYDKNSLLLLDSIFEDDIVSEAKVKTFRK